MLAAVTVVAIDRLMERRGLLPTLFHNEVRRIAASLLLFLTLWGTVFAAVGLLGTPTPVDFQAPPTPQLFVVHLILLVTLAIWYGLGFVGGEVGAGVDPARTSLPRQFGLRVPSIATELGLGVLCGIAAWVVVLTILVGLGALVWALGGEDALPQEAPPIVPWIASLPVALRLAVSASAGFAEELFFRGFLQPRIGVALSTALFALAHLSYDQPTMLVGVTLLSLTFAWIVRWRQSIWAAIVAHAVFDAIQLLVVIPWALRHLEPGSAELIAGWVW